MSLCRKYATVRARACADGKCKDDCCITGTTCCGTGCIPDNELPFTLCAAVEDGCCNNPDLGNGCPIVLPPPVDDDPNDDSECCDSGEECCAGRCIKEQKPTTSGVIAFCPTKRGCCPPPPPSDECGTNCCQPGLDCICGNCAVFTGFPVLCAADSGTCCGDPENPCATDV